MQLPFTKPLPYRPTDRPPFCLHVALSAATQLLSLATIEPQSRAYPARPVSTKKKKKKKSLPNACHILNYIEICAHEAGSGSRSWSCSGWAPSDDRESGVGRTVCNLLAFSKWFYHQSEHTHRHTHTYIYILLFWYICLICSYLLLWFNFPHIIVIKLDLQKCFPLSN